MPSWSLHLAYQQLHLLVLACRKVARIMATQADAWHHVENAPYCTYWTLRRVVSELLVLTVVWLIGKLSPTWSCACWLSSATNDGADNT